MGSRRATGRTSPEAKVGIRRYLLLLAASAVLPLADRDLLLMLCVMQCISYQELYNTHNIHKHSLFQTWSREVHGDSVVMSPKTINNEVKFREILELFWDSASSCIHHTNRTLSFTNMQTEFKPKDLTQPMPFSACRHRQHLRSFLQALKTPKTLQNLACSAIVGD